MRMDGRMTTTEMRRPMPAIPAAVPHADHRVFPVRFSPTLDISGLLRRPQNSYRWAGQGALLVDEHGVRVSARRLTLLGLYRTVLFIPPTQLREVYREGDSIRIDLQAGTRHDFFRFWAESAGAAAEIVRRLPTSRTIELEGPAWNSGRASSDVYWSAIGLALAVALVGSFAWLGAERFLSHDGAATRVELQKFTQRFDSMSSQFGTAFTALQRGSLSQEEFVSRLEKWLLPQWEALGAEPGAANNSEIRAVIDNWHRALMAYARGLRDHDPSEVFSAFSYIRVAEAEQARAHERLDELDSIGSQHLARQWSHRDIGGPGEFDRHRHDSEAAVSDHHKM